MMRLVCRLGGTGARAFGAGNLALKAPNLYLP
jgi:hypothetical protein